MSDLQYEKKNTGKKEEKEKDDQNKKKGRTRKHGKMRHVTFAESYFYFWFKSWQTILRLLFFSFPVFTVTKLYDLFNQDEGDSERLINRLERLTCRGTFKQKNPDFNLM